MQFGGHSRRRGAVCGKAARWPSWPEEKDNKAGNPLYMNDLVAWPVSSREFYNYHWITLEKAFVVKRCGRA